MSRITLQEVAEIAQLASRRRAVLHGTGPTVDGVAQALGLPPAQVQGLLQEVRGAPADLLGGDDRATLRRSLVGLAATAAVLVVFVAWGLLGGLSDRSGPTGSAPGVASSSASGAGPGLSAANEIPPPSGRSRPNAVGVSGGPPDSGLSSTSLGLGPEYVKDASTDINHALEKARSRRQNAALMGQSAIQ